MKEKNETIPSEQLSTAEEKPTPEAEHNAKVMERHHDLLEAARQIRDLRNSIDAVVKNILDGRPDDARRAYALGLGRFKNAHILLAKHVDKLPTLTL